MIINENERREDTTITLTKRVKGQAVIYARDNGMSLSRLVENLLKKEMNPNKA